VFENIIEQGAVSQLRDDINCGRCAPSMLFYGPPNTGKGSAALELARVISCENDASWKCSCPSCGRHRILSHDDLLILGKKSFAAEINACCSIFLRKDNSQSAKFLFFRSLRKLQMRFSPVLMEDDPKFAKISSVLQSLDEGLNEFLSISTESEDQTGTRSSTLEKICNSLVKDALFLDEEGMGSLIPVGQIRKASYWCRLAPSGKKKTLIIENAQDMRDESRNSLLKLLEEPPLNVSIVLTALRRETIMPTILSRLRPYRFLKRSEEGEKEVLRRVFQVSSDEAKSISTYLDSFLAGSEEKLYPLAAWFIVSLARISSLSIKKSNRDIPQFLTALGERYSQAYAPDFERIVKSANLVKALLEKSGNFEGDSFSLFLKLCLEMASCVAREENDPQFTAFNSILKKYIGEAVTAVDVLNQSTALALEALVYKLKTALTRGQYG